MHRLLIVSCLAALAGCRGDTTAQPDFGEPFSLQLQSGTKVVDTTVELPDGSLHKVYFDVTEMWKKWKPPG